MKGGLVLAVFVSLSMLVGVMFLRSRQKNLTCMANVRSLEQLYYVYEAVHGKAPLSIDELKGIVSERHDIIADSFDCPWSGKQYILNPELSSISRANGVPIIWCPEPHKYSILVRAEGIRTVAFRDYEDGGIRQVPESDFELIVERQDQPLNDN